MSYAKDLKEWNALHANPPENWREIWENRRKITCCTSRPQAERFLKKVQPDYKDELKIDLHPKDGFVVYYDRL